MSRIGNKEIDIPQGITVTIEEKSISIEGKKGKLVCSYDPRIEIVMEGNSLKLINKSDEKHLKAKHGLYRALLNNMIVGVAEGFAKTLELNGVGYRVQQKGKGIDLSLGYSHNIVFDAPEGVELKVEGNNKIIVSGKDKQAVGEVAAKIRKLRKPDPYKGKGIKYSYEKILKKQGKTVKK